MTTPTNTTTRSEHLPPVLADEHASLLVLGRTLPLRDSECYRDTVDGFWIQAWFSDGTWTVLVMSDSYPRTVEVRVSAPTLTEAERAWLASASLEAPRLCALVVDGMACRFCGGDGWRDDDLAGVAQLRRCGCVDDEVTP